MKRNWEVIKEILIAVEGSESPLNAKITLESFDDSKLDVYYYHFDMLCGTNLVDSSIDMGQHGIKYFNIQSLTFEGHDFLDTIRSDTVWNKVKELSMKKSIELTFDSIKKLSALAITSLAS